ncbi:MAG TPA: hypothetical protein VFA13_04430 [Candidatus Acidoferrum sp.]|nr:hypothetical protein [Candidatus Acidoferrum sp.]
MSASADGLPSRRTRVAALAAAPIAAAPMVAVAAAAEPDRRAVETEFAKKLAERLIAAGLRLARK